MSDIGKCVTIIKKYYFSWQVAMVLKTPPEICSEGTPNVFSAKKEFIVKATDTFTVTYVVIGVKVGEWPITVGIGSTKGSDGVRKKLNVIVSFFLNISSN